MFSEFQSAIVFGCAFLFAVPQRAAERNPPIRVTQENRITHVYLGKDQVDGRTEIVCEMPTMKFLSNQRICSCIMVNGKIVYIKEYNLKDSYVRGHVELGDADHLVIFSGVLEHVEWIDPHDHAALWKAFVNSGRTPFSAKRAKLPPWWVWNPIRERKVLPNTGAD